MLNISINGYMDRVRETCSKCRGEGSYWLNTMPLKTELVGPADYDPNDGEVVPKYRETCDVCNGEGSVLPKDGDVVEVYQRDKFVCKCTIPATLRPHIFVDQRPGDFIPAIRNGKMIYIMSPSLCPGDWELLEGFAR